MHNLLIWPGVLPLLSALLGLLWPRRPTLIGVAGTGPLRQSVWIDSATAAPAAH
jgi:hypothetical protein